MQELEIIQKKAQSFAEFLPTIATTPLEHFDQELHTRLYDLIRMTEDFPQHREYTRKFALEITEADLTSGYMQKQVRTKPYGYAGDFQVIDWMYRELEDSDVINGMWDTFYHRQGAATSVRNRKEYLKKIFNEIVFANARPIKVLDFASGPCRDLAEAIDEAGDACHGSLIHCVDVEPKAIEYAQKVTKPYASLVNFKWECANVFRFRSEERYDLVWSAGLFDYLNDKLATALIAKMWQHTAEGGKMIVGNFHPRNPTRNYMEWCMDWILIHRTEDELKQLGINAGIPESVIEIDQEPLGVCIFLVARK